MDAPTTVTRTQILYGLCLSLAALIGFFLTDPLKTSSLFVIGLLLVALVWPLFARCYHPFLVISLHSVFVFGFLPGTPPLWVAVAIGGLLIVVFRRSIDAGVRLVPPGGVGWALVGLGIVVLATALIRGGIGLRAFGATSMGSKKYVYVLAGIASFFVLASRPIPRKQAVTYVALFCLSGLTCLFSHLVYMAGQKFYWLFSLIDSGPAETQAIMDWDVTGSRLFRSGSSVAVASALITFMLMRLGLRQSLNLRKPWRLLSLVGCIGMGTLGGFRSFLVTTALLMVVMFLLEGLHRTRLLAWTAVLSLVGAGLLVSCSERLPLSVQRSISFLPVPIDEHVKQDAEGSLNWRLEMWDELKHDVPEYFFLGKGYAIDRTLLEMSKFNAYFGFGLASEWAILAGEYHNGPLSIAIPFGIWGVLAFCWLLFAGVLRLYWFCRNGDPDLQNINRVLCAMFIAKIIFFAFFFGAFNSDIVEFAAIAGLAEALNASPSDSPTEPEGQADSPHPGEEYST
jgi:hypothetical protein